MNMVRLPSQEEQQNSEFSRYLRDKECPFPGPSPTEQSRIQTFIAPKIVQENNNRKSSVEDDEIGVFRAEKYFNEDVTEASSRASSHNRGPNQRPTMAEAHNLEQVKARLQPKTPTSVRSESSWNSQSVLLQNNASLAGAPARNGSLSGKRFLKRFGCSCSDKKSVRTREYSGEMIKSSLPSVYDGHGRNSDGIEDAASVKPPRLRSFRSEKTPVFRPSGSSDVFGSSPALIRSGMKTMSLERRLSMMTWNRPSPEEIVLSGRSGEGGNVFVSAPGCNDSDSDGSSDLFEIDSLTGKSPNPFRSGRRTSGDRNIPEVTSGCATPTTGYAPSETSIQWSVVTASAADCEDYGVPRRSSAAAMESAQRRRAILGCKSQKAVGVVAGDVYLASPGPGSRRFMADSPARFQAEMARIDRQYFPRLESPSPRNNSHLLYIK